MEKNPELEATAIPINLSDTTPQAQRNEKLRRKKLHKLNKQLHAELSKNVELHNKYSRALSILRKVDSQNQDLLEVLAEFGAEDPTLASAPKVPLTKEQQEMFNALMS